MLIADQQSRAVTISGDDDGDREQKFNEIENIYTLKHLPITRNKLIEIRE